MYSRLKAPLGLGLGLAFALGACGGADVKVANPGPSAPIVHVDATSCAPPPIVFSCMNPTSSSCNEFLGAAVKNSEALREACPSPSIASNKPCPRTSPTFVGCCLMRMTGGDSNICYYAEAKAARSVCIDLPPYLQVPAWLEQRRGNTYGWCAPGAPTPELEAGKGSVAAAAPAPAAPAEAVPPSGTSTSSVADRLLKLKEMFDKGLIDQADYDRKKQELVDSL